MRKRCRCNYSRQGVSEERPDLSLWCTEHNERGENRLINLGGSCVSKNTLQPPSVINRATLGTYLNTTQSSGLNEKINHCNASWLQWKLSISSRPCAYFALNLFRSAGLQAQYEMVSSTLQIDFCFFKYIVLCSLLTKSWSHEIQYCSFIATQNIQVLPSGDEVEHFLFGYVAQQDAARDKSVKEGLKLCQLISKL